MTNKINTFIIPHNNYENLRKTLESIRRNTIPNFYIYLIDQNPEYQKVDDLVDLHIFTGGKNLGFAKAMNTGIRLSDTPFVSCWNDDAECINKKWWDGVMETFNRYSTALGVNPSSPRIPSSPGGPPVNEWDYRENFTDEEYDKLVKEHGKGYIIDGICTFATVYRKDLLDSVKGVIRDKCWYDEYFFPGGGEDYDLNRRAYMSGMRMLGTGLSYIWHWWYSTKVNGVCGVKHCGSAFDDKWEVGSDIYGKKGRQDVPLNKIIDL
jgi:GT2 family glycosyltransferase